MWKKNKYNRLCERNGNIYNRLWERNEEKNIYNHSWEDKIIKFVYWRYKYKHLLGKGDNTIVSGQEEKKIVYNRSLNGI